MRIPFPRLLVCFFLLLAAGCSTIQSRIEQRQDVFSTLSAEQQEKIRKGIVEIGYTPDMVYMAMGAPSEKRSKATRDGKRTTWIYNTYYEDWVGRTFAGYRRVVVYDQKTGRRYIIHEPVFENVYRSRKEERIRVEFTDGLVSAIEQRK